MTMATTRPIGSSTKQFQFGDFDFHEKLGEGGCGTVTRVSFKKPYEGHRVAAVKNVLELRREEIEILAHLRHKNIVVLYGWVQMGPMNMIVLEYAPLGSVRDYIKHNGCTPIRGHLLLKWLRESALALQHLHSNHVIHRDIKGANCILFEGNLLKLADFGIARYIGESIVTSSAKGTWRYMAPEINSKNHFSFASDLYAYGMLAIEMVSGKEPFEGSEWQYVVYKVVESNLRPDIPRDCPKSVALLMRICWSKNPGDRPSADDIVHILHSDNSPGFDALRLVVVGSQGYETTSVSRRVLFHTDGKEEHPIGLQGPSITCKMIQGKVFGTVVTLVDTLDCFGVTDTQRMPNNNIVAQVQFQSAPGPHAFLLVIQINSPPKIIRNTVAQLRRCFGENVYKHVVVLFTRDIDDSSLLPISEYIHRNRDIRQILRDCGNRYLEFNNTCAADSNCNQDQIKRLLTLINHMISTNGGKCIKFSV